MMSLNQFRSGVLAKIPFGFKRLVATPRETGLKVRLLETSNRRPATTVERVVVNLLSREREMPLEKLVDFVADDLYREEHRAGGWAVDVGLFGSGLFVAEARRTLESGNGELWQIG